MPASQRSKLPNRLKPFYLPTATPPQKLRSDLYLRRSHSSDTANPAFQQKRLAFVRPVLQKTLAKWMLQSWSYSRRKNLNDLEKFEADRRCFVQIPSLGGVELKTKNKEGHCRKLIKNKSSAAGCIPKHKPAVFQAGIGQLGDGYCGKDVTTYGASCSRHLAVGAVSCGPPLFTLPVSEAIETSDCLNFDKSSASGCDGDGTTCALKSCMYKEDEEITYAEKLKVPESRNFPNCVKLCASVCEEGHLNRQTRVLSKQPCQALKITTLQREDKKTGNQPQTFCDAFSQFLMCSSRAMDAVKQKIDKFPDEKAQCMAAIPLDCNTFSNLCANISAKKQLDFSKEMPPEVRTKMSVKEQQEFSDEAPYEHKTHASVKLQLDLNDETFPDHAAEISSKASPIYIDAKLPDVESHSSGKGRSDYNSMKGTFKTDLGQSDKLDMNNQPGNDSVAIAGISCVRKSISDVSNLVSDDLNCTNHKIPPETGDISATCNGSPRFLDQSGFAGNVAQCETAHGKLISAEENRIEKSTELSSNDLKDDGAEETMSSCAVKRVTLLKGFMDPDLNSEHEQQNIVRSKVAVSENLDSGISDSEQASSRHTTDSSQGSLGAVDVAMEPTEHVTMETAKDIAMEMSDWHESQCSGAVPVHCNHSSVKHADASVEDMTEDITIVEDSSDSDACSRLRALESHCRPVQVLLRRLTSEAIDAFCSHPEPPPAVKSPQPQPEELPQIKTPKKKDPPLSPKPPRQPKLPKSETKKRKPKPPSWEKDDLAESITLDLLNWLPDLVENGLSVRRSSSATKRKFDGSVSDESLDDSTPYIPNFLTHSNFDPPGCSLLEKWQKVCELEREWLEESGTVPAYLSYQSATKMGDSLLSLNKSGNLSTGGLHGSLLNKSPRGSAAETPKRKSKPRKKEVTGTALDGLEGQSKTPRKTKPRKQSKKTEVDVSDETSSDTRSSLPSCQNSAKLMQKVTIVGGNSCGGNTDSGSTLNESPHNRNTLTGGTTTASPITSIPQLANALDGNSPKVNCITIKPVIKRCLNGNFITGSIRSGTMLVTNSLAGNANSTDIETRNAMTGNDSNDSIRNTIAVKTANTSTGPGNTPTESTPASTSAARNATNGNSSGKNSQTRNFIVIHSVPRKDKTSVCSADKLQGITDSSGDSLSGQTEIDETSDTTMGSGLISKLTTDTVQFGQEKKPLQKFSVLPQLTTAGKQLPLTLSLNVKQTSSPVSDSNFPPFKRSKNTVIISGSQNKSEKFQSSNANFTQRIAIKLPVASTSGSSRQVPGNLSMIRSIKVVSASCHAGVSTSNIPAAITGIVPVTAGTPNSSAGVTSIASLTSTTSSPLTSVSSSIVSAAHTGGRSLLNSCIDSSVVKTKFLASSSISVPPSQTLNTEQAAESSPTKQVNIVVTSHSLSDDLKSSSTEGTKSQLDSAEMKPPKLRKTTKPRVKPASSETRSSTSDARNSLIGNCGSDGTDSGLPTLKKASVACKLDVKVSAGEPAQMDGETSEPKCNEELSSWLAASMGLYTCPCGAAFSDNWSCHEHQINCSSGPSE